MVFTNRNKIICSHINALVDELKGFPLEARSSLRRNEKGGKKSCPHSDHETLKLQGCQEGKCNSRLYQMSCFQ